MCGTMWVLVLPLSSLHPSMSNNVLHLPLKNLHQQNPASHKAHSNTFSPSPLLDSATDDSLHVKCIWWWRQLSVERRHQCYSGGSVIYTGDLIVWKHVKKIIKGVCVLKVKVLRTELHFWICMFWLDYSSYFVIKRVENRSWIRMQGCTAAQLHQDVGRRTLGTVRVMYTYCTRATEKNWAK